MLKPAPGWLAVFIVGALVLSGSCGLRPHPDHIDVLFIIVDTLRADHLGCYAYERARTPVIDGLASRGARFETVVTAAPVTAPSVSSLLTSTLPVFHGVRDNELFSLSKNLPRLPSVFHEAGYSTAGFVGSVVLHRRHGFAEGFDHYDDDMSAEYVCYAESYAPQHDQLQGTQRRADEVTAAALEWLASHGHEGPFFCMVHYFDPHDPYDPPPESGADVGGAPYDGEISFADSQIGELIEGMKEMGLYDGTLVVLTADHGEALGEHLERTHGFFLYDSTALVPLIISLPGVVPDGVTFSPQVRTIDIMPTILDLAGVPAPKTVQGSSLAPALLGREKLRDREAYIETYHTLYSYRWHELTAVRTPQWKYVRAPKAELYSLQRDPDELVNLIDAEPEIASQMDASLRSLEGDFQSGSDRYAASCPEYDPGMIDKMRALGYVGGARPRGAELPEPGGDLPDPKDEMARLNARQEAGGRLREAATLILRGDLDAALQKVGEAERIAPGYAGVQATRGLILVKKGELDEGTMLLEKAVESDPRAQMVHQTLNNLGLAYLQQGRCDKAIDALERSLKTKPDYRNAMYNLGLAKETCGDAPGAIRSYEAFVGTNSGKDPVVTESVRSRIEELKSSHTD